jgi:ubiquinone/menaquinone biosynthesis C-methylase UbiE
VEQSKRATLDRAVYEEWFELETYHWWFVGRRILFIRLLEQALVMGASELKTGLRMVDMGCGTGVMLDSLSRFGEVIGVDVSRTALSFCRERKPYVLCQAPMDHLPFRSGRIDLLTAFDVLEHGEDDQAMLREAYRVCAPGGLAMFSVPAYHFMWGDHDVAAHHYRRYSSEEIRKIVERAGFHIRRMTYLNSFLFPLSVVFRHSKNVLVNALRRMGISVRSRSDFRSTGLPLMNPILLKIFRAESLLLRQTNLPFGLTICCIAQKPGLTSAASSDQADAGHGNRRTL